MQTNRSTDQPNLRRLDAYLNAAVLAAKDDFLMASWWRRKVAIKRELAALDPTDVDEAAGRVLAGLLREQAA